MEYGYFNDIKNEYIITKPDTPYPWINYLGMKDYFTIISNTGGGYSFYKDASKRRITRYRYNNVPLDSGGKYYYIVEDDDYWSPMWAPVKQKLDNYECRHGLGYSTIIGERNELKCVIDYFVPIDDNCEIHSMKLVNNSDEVKSFKLFSFVEFCLWDAYDDMTNFQRNYNIGEVEVKDSIIYHKSEYRERRNHYSFFSVNEKIDGFDTDREKFLGKYNGFNNPQVIQNAKANNSIVSGWAPIGSHLLNITLKPNEKKNLVFILGYIENDQKNKWSKNGIINKSKALSLIDKYSTSSNVNKEKQKLNSYWNKKLTNFKLKTNDQKLNRMVNIWNQYQSMVTFNLARSASYFESGISRGIGFRDSNQDLMGTVHMIPQRVKKRLINLASTQFEDGSTYHQYQPLTKKGNDKIGSGFNDDPLWLIFGVVSYIKETNDYQFLDKDVPFNNGKRATIFDHLKASFKHVTKNLGPHGLPLIGHADWNDCLNLNSFSNNPDESFQTIDSLDDSKAESLLIAGMFVTIGSDMIQLSKNVGKEKLALKYEKQVNEMKENINKYGRDDEWFLRAYDYYGNKVGSKENEYAKIFIESQAFCIMGGIGLKDGFAQTALSSVYNKLNTKYGLMLLNPSYKEYRVDRGEISSYPPGYKENGGIFCHNNPWIIIAETILGNGNRAFEYYKKITPTYLKDFDLHRIEPYVYSQMIAGKEAPNFGEGKNSWLTGTSAWSFIAITQYILGIRPTFKGLLIDPCIPDYWDGFKVKRKFRNKVFNIEVINKNGVSKGIKSIELNGKQIKKNIIVPDKLNENNNVKVIL